MNPMAFLPFVAGAAAALGFLSHDADAAPIKAAAQLENTQGRAVGLVELVETSSGMLQVTATTSDLPAGKHAIHIHQTGKCDAGSGFKSAGDHLAGGRKHGVFNEDGPHPGDLPNLYVQNDGKAVFEAFVPEAPVKNGWFGNAGLFDGDGAAVVVHAVADDYASQPSGSSGDRIACGVVERR